MGPEAEVPLRSRAPVSGVRHAVLGMLCLLSFVLYLDRICIGQAVGAIQKELNLSHTEMGLVLGAFTVAYGLFEIPAGHRGDRFGSRLVLTFIVSWWSAFTMLTGLANGFAMLLVVRFLFGAGEAGALPNAARVVARWFPAGARGPAQGAVITAALLGGAISPVTAEYLIQGVGWRWAFLLLGIPGITWAVIFYLWFRDDPAEHPWVSQQELDYLAPGSAPAGAHQKIRWSEVLCQANIWLLGGVMTSSASVTYLVFSWYPSYLKEARGVSPTLASWLTSLVLAAGAAGSLLGGWLGDWLVRRTGDSRLSRCGTGIFAFLTAAAALAGSAFCDSPELAAGCAAWACFVLHVHLAAWWGVVTEISGKHLGALFGLLNMMGVPGAVGSQVFLGGFVDRLKGLGLTGRNCWDPAFFLYADLLVIGALCWVYINPRQRVIRSQEAGPG